MAIRDLNNEEMLQLLTSYEIALNSALSQSDNEEDIALLNCMVANMNFIKWVMQIQAPSNKFTWKIMTFMSGTPQILNSTRTYPWQYDSDQNINKNIQSLYYNLLLNNAIATENIKNHIKKNSNIKIISGLLSIFSLSLIMLLAPWSPWCVSFLIPLYSIFALPLIVILFLSIGIEITSKLHSFTLLDLYLRHDNVEKFKNNIDENGISNAQKTVKFFQPNNSNNLLPLVERLYEQPTIQLPNLGL